MYIFCHIYSPKQRLQQVVRNLILKCYMWVCFPEEQNYFSTDGSRTFTISITAQEIDYMQKISEA